MIPLEHPETLFTTSEVYWGAMIGQPAGRSTITMRFDINPPFPATKVASFQKKINETLPDTGGRNGL